MTQSLELKSGFVGIIHYTLLHEDGGLIESSVGRQPQPYLHGADNLMPGLEAALAGKVAGDIIKGQAAPKEAFGEHNGQEAHRVKRNELPNDREWVAGMPLQVQASNGQVVWLWIEKIEGAWVWLSTNHPLAGKTITFEAEVVGVRPAKPVELEHGYPHGLDGDKDHHH